MSSSRRTWLKTAGTAAGLVALQSLKRPLVAAEAEQEPPALSASLTQFQLACMTLPYQDFPLTRALQGIQKAGFQYVAWGTTHRNSPGSEKIPVMAADAPPSKAAELAKQCRDLGLTPVMMFSDVYPEAENAVEILTSRIRQADAADIPQVLTFGHNEGAQRKVWIERFKKLGPIARDHGVTLVIKQHGGSTGTGQACAETVAEINDPNVMVNYDAGNVMDYLDVDPIADITHCADSIRSFCIKDHRNWPKDQDCGPGFGVIDHYRLLNTVATTGLVMPLCFENISAPLTPRPKSPDEVDALASRARIYLVNVIAGLQDWKQQEG